MTSRKSPPYSLVGRLVLGAFAGITGAACMDLVRFAARRGGIIDRRISEEAARAVSRDLLGAEGGTAVARGASGVIVERTLHFGYGAALAAALAACRPRPSIAKGVLFGLGTWVLGSGFVLPALRARVPFWKAGLPENIVDAAAHITYGVVATWGLTELIIEKRSDSLDAAKSG